jgi:hypothetical protein
MHNSVEAFQYLADTQLCRIRHKNGFEKPKPVFMADSANPTTKPDVSVKKETRVR